MTDIPDKDDNMREAIGKKLKFWRKKELSDLYYPLDEIMELFQAREQQLLAELLGELPDSLNIDFEKSLKVIGLSEDYCKGHNKALSRVVAVIKQRMDGGLETSEEAQCE
jgi:hypothetical protein